MTSNVKCWKWATNKNEGKKQFIYLMCLNNKCVFIFHGNECDSWVYRLINYYKSIKIIFFAFCFQTSGDLNLARRCLRLCLSSDGSHGAALNNLAVISTQLGQFTKAKSYLTAAKAVLSNSDEVEQNIKLISKYAWFTKCSICFIAICL